jgi:tetracycline 7-halogenase / FADH2 O2-dependent halogenase
VRADIAIIGSGFAGSLMAMIARRLGFSVVLIERGRHPRFAIGESSTPLANLLLEEIAREYDLPGLLPLCKWGVWQREHPEIACGLKRGFSFFHHVRDLPFVGDGRHELLVAASPCDAIADTHWYRADVDSFLSNQAQALGAEYLDQTDARLVSTGGGVTLDLTRTGSQIELRADFLVDASGPRGFAHRALGMRDDAFAGMPGTQALFAHFTGVQRWDALHSLNAAAPFSPDDAALHHVFEGGWMWVLRFNNEITSAGVVVTDALASELRLADGAAAWERVLKRLPSAARQFGSAKAVTPFIHHPRVTARSSSVTGANWAMLPSAAGFVDPLLSTGIPLTVLGILRLADVLSGGRSPDELAKYGARTHGELDATARLVGALYANMGNFEVFSALTMLYFAAASYSESARRLKRPERANSFLLHDDRRFGPELRACCDAALTGGGSVALIERIHAAIEPFDVAGLARRERAPWFPCLAEDFLSAAHKLGATRGEAAGALARAGFAVSQSPG